MTEQEIFEKLKEALDYDYLCTDWGGTEVTNLEEYLRAIKRERDIEKHFADVEVIKDFSGNDRVVTAKNIILE